MDATSIIRKSPEALSALASLVELHEKEGEALEKLIDVIRKGVAENTAKAESPKESAPPTKEEVREALMKKEVKEIAALFAEYGARKLSEIPEERYEELLVKAARIPDREES